ncbi:MAG: hypothetical protein L0Y36_01305 [Planctomycetales bacterium]|nr:hypothetical protein [Planctomycetales bacterium]
MAVILTGVLLCLGCSQRIISGNAWEDKLNEDLLLFGHRNWIVVADSAYPKQSRPGIETVAANKDHLEVLASVVESIEKATHVKANIYLDAELNYVSDENTPGVKQYREQLKKMLGSQNIKELPHEEIIYKLDEAAETFNILILKTDFAVPYTSVFFELDCGYWNAQKERELRQSLSAEK